MKIRIGFGLGTRTLTNDAASFGPFVDTLERLHFDSLWLSERLTGDAPDPLVALAYAAGRTEKLKLGTSVLVVPGRNPVVLAKELASLDRLSNGRLLPAVGLGAPVPAEHRAFGVDRKQRAGLFNEAIGLMRRLWTEDHVTHEGEHFAIEDVTLLPRPVQSPMDVWLGGSSPSELRRTGRLGDGWLPSFCTVDDVAQGWPVVTAAAADAGREIEEEHLGALIAYSHSGVPETVRTLLAMRRPELDPALVIPIGFDGLRARIEAFCEVGASKFVVIPIDEPQSWDDELSTLADTLMPLQT
ncbi:MAG: TIGR03619 family F420-dependent LLM class oxidoreductase [Actinomycetota bacterium]|nr:TIGR03619 family F420-dependent LLM class oxidoreductase [Actinomycetota bacterium]